MNHLIMKLALALLPPSRRAWGEAMMGEFAALPERQTDFALGCLGASLKETIMTGEGLARIGFGLVVAASIWLTAFWTQSSLQQLAAAEYNLNGTLFWLFDIQSVILFPIILGIAAFKAAKIPTNRLHLARTGFSATSACLWVSAFLQAASCVVSIAFIMEAKENNEPVETSLSIGFVTGVIFLCVAFYARQGPRMMRNAAATAALLSLSFAAIVAIQQIGLTEIVGHNLVPTALIMTVLLSLTACAGALFTWMGRPAHPIDQR
jgi:heme/copper-type cytochrome/quinol oxidase subunit 3